MLAEGRVRFQATRFTDAFLIEAERALDARGYFMRTYCARAFAERGLETTFVQDSTSFSKLRGTVRGMHFQKAPHEEVKVVRCLKGAILDVIIDVRPTSWTFLQAQAFELSADNERQLYIPKGFAHGFQTL
ncbi:MAG: dTDP-4-dehydrorhamnose 3,5-epimerase family protein, partial [Hyphomicrobiaceae bacterium]|nr:dTDP-4-dehydrorhamnose 3,5-epimerase family protein [Hyphomicrobiaceae bacterium]